MNIAASPELAAAVPSMQELVGPCLFVPACFAAGPQHDKVTNAGGMGVWGGVASLQRSSIGRRCAQKTGGICGQGELHAQDVQGQDQGAEGESEGPKRTFWGRWMALISFGSDGGSALEADGSDRLVWNMYPSPVPCYF